MLDMTSKTKTARLAMFAALLAPMMLSGCKTTSLASNTDPEPAQGDEVLISKTRSANDTEAGNAYVDPYVVSANDGAPAQGELQTLPGSEATAASLGELVAQPTGVRASHSSIFSTGVAAPETSQQVDDSGAILPASSYPSNAGVNATVYSVYGNGRMPTGAQQSQIE